MTTQHQIDAPGPARPHMDLGVMRTEMAADRNLMAWVRTSISMLSFGFAIYKILQSIQEQGIVLRRPDTPRNVGMFLVGAGTLSMVMGTIDYWVTIKKLRRLQYVPLVQPTLILAVVMCILGTFLWVTIMTRLF